MKGRPIWGVLATAISCTLIGPAQKALRAVYLGQFANDATCAAFLARLKEEGLEAVDIAAGQSSEGVLHGEKCLSATLRPTLERLSRPEKLALEFAALLPPDQVPLFWLRVFVAETFPEMAHDAEPGYPDPWMNVVRRLFSLRLLQPTEALDQDRQPRVVRMHRLLQELARSGMRVEAQPSSTQRMRQHLDTMSEFFRWMMRGESRGHEWEKQWPWIDDRAWWDELLATFTSGIWSQEDDSHNGFSEESWLCEIALREWSLIGPNEEIRLRDFMLTQLLTYNALRDESIPDCLVAYLDLLKAFHKYGMSSFTPSRFGFHCVDDILESLFDFLRNHRNAKFWQGFTGWAADLGIGECLCHSYKWRAADSTARVKQPSSRVISLAASSSPSPRKCPPS